MSVIAEFYCFFSNLARFLLLIPLFLFAVACTGVIIFLLAIEDFVSGVLRWCLEDEE